MNSQNKKESVLVIGASPEPSRYAFLASRMLQEYGHKVVCFGKHKGECAGIDIINEFPDSEPVDTVTLYLNPKHQAQYYGKIVELKPKRVVFNPGAENDEFEALLEENGIEPIEACTLVMLRTNQW